MRKIVKLLNCYIVILLLTLTSLGINEVYAATADLSLSPASQSLQKDQSFSVEIRLNTNGESINTVTANLSYSPDKLRAISVDTSGSFVTIWFENNIATASGQIKLTGSVPTPGVSGSSLLFAKINFTTLAEGTATVSFDTTSAVYRNSDNTDILGTKTGGSYTITAATPTVTPTITQTVVPTSTVVPTRTLPNVGVNWPTQFLLVFSVFLIISGTLIFRLL